MNSSISQTGVVWKIQGIGDFTNRDIIIALNVSRETLYQVRKKYNKTGKLPHWWQKALWLMVYDQNSIRRFSYYVDEGNSSVLYVRNNILRLTTKDFGVLFGIGEKKVSSLEFRERAGEKHGHLTNVLLKLLSTPESRVVTIRRLLHLARSQAQTPNEHEAVTRLRRLLIPR